MITSRSWLLVAGILGLVSCSEKSGPDVVPIGANDLEIATLEIQHTANADDSMLTIRGLGSEGEEIAVATLRTGTVSYTPEPGVMAPGLSLGTELNIAVDGQTFHLITPELAAQELLEPSQPAVAQFARLDAVAAALSTEASIHFVQRPVAGEAAFAFGATSCTARAFPTNKGNPYSCCQEGTSNQKETWHVYANDSLGHRAIGTTACRTLAGSSACSGSDCTFGPCKARVVEQWTTATSHVFHYSAGDTQCGWDNGTGGYNPEPYVGQTDWAPLTASCTCTGCSNGVPTPAGCVN